MATITHISGFAAVMIEGREVTPRRVARLELNDHTVARLEEPLVFHNVHGEGLAKVRIFRTLSSDEWIFEFAWKRIAYGETIRIMKVPDAAPKQAQC